MNPPPPLDNSLYLAYNSNLSRAMVFVDGENLSMRYAAMLKERDQKPGQGVVFEPDVFVWRPSWPLTTGLPMILRKYYYTSVKGDYPRIEDMERKLKSVGIEAPRVFKRESDGRSKRVDITLSTDMLLHAARKNYDAAVLITGDADFIPLIEAVQGEGARVFVWALSNGLSPRLELAADDFRLLDRYLVGE